MHRILRFSVCSFAPLGCLVTQLGPVAAPLPPGFKLAAITLSHCNESNCVNTSNKWRGSRHSHSSPSLTAGVRICSCLPTLVWANEVSQSHASTALPFHSVLCLLACLLACMHALQQYKRPAGEASSRLLCHDGPRIPAAADHPVARDGNEQPPRLRSFPKVRQCNGVSERVSYKMNHHSIL